MTNIQLITIITFWIITLAIGFGVLAHKEQGEEVLLNKEKVLWNIYYI
jgi:hypothetical protein